MDDLALSTVVSYLGHKDISIRVVAIDSLKGFGSRATSPLVSLLSKDEPIEVRRAAVDALGVIQDPKSVSHVSRLLANQELRQESLNALGHIPSSRSARALCRFLGRQNLPESEKVLALQALERLGNPIALPYLLKCYGESDENLRVLCAHVMAKCHRVQDVPQLIKLYNEEQSDVVLEALARAIGRKSNSEYLRNFHDDLKSRNSGVRTKALLVINRFRDTSSVRRVQLLLQNPPSRLSKQERKLVNEMLDVGSNSF